MDAQRGPPHSTEGSGAGERLLFEGLNGKVQRKEDDADEQRDEHTCLLEVLADQQDPTYGARVAGVLSGVR